MPRRWQLRRTPTPYSDGQHRWDRAYQLLLSWTTPTLPQEATNAQCDLCPGLDAQPSPDPNDRQPNSAVDPTPQSPRNEILPLEAIFRDDGYSGASLNRPGLDHLRDRIRHREIDRVLITTPDRLGPGTTSIRWSCSKNSNGAGCQVEYLERPMSHDPHDQLVLQIRSAVAEYERTLITDRMRRGRLMKLQAGALLPWTHPPYGYQVDPDHPRDPTGATVDPAKAAVVRDLFSRYAEVGESLHRLSRYLHQHGIVSPTGKSWWGLPTIRGILTNPVYTGTVYMSRVQYRPPTIRRSATHPLGRPKDSGRVIPQDDWVAISQIPALIDQDLFSQVQEKLAHNQTFAQRHNTRHFYLLRALVSCGRCLRASSARTVGKYSYYLCTGKGKPMHTGTDVPCAARFTPAQQLDDLVWADLCAVLTHPEELGFAPRTRPWRPLAPTRPPSASRTIIAKRCAVWSSNELA